MDVHDTAIINRDIPLKEGMLITIEPGNLKVILVHLIKYPYHEYQRSNHTIKNKF